MRFAKAMGCIIGGIALAAAGLALGAFLGHLGAGPAVAVIGVGSGIILVEYGLSAW